MKAKILTVACLLLIGLCACAQNYDDIKKQINSIKKSSQYIYGEATAETQDEAKGIAEDLLYQEINTWSAKKKKFKNSPNLVVNNRKDLIASFSLPRGNMYRYFVYVKKADIIPAENTEVLHASSRVASVPATSTVEMINATQSVREYPEVVQTISSYKDYYNMADKIKQLKNEGKISHYARYASLENPDIYYLAIYNTSGKVVAILAPGKDRINVITGQTDKITNYSGCGAIGFIVNE